MNGIRSFVPPTLRTVTLLLMVLMVGVVMMSAQTKTNAPAKKKATTTAAKQTAKTPAYNPDAGQKIYIDPVTKEIVQPSAEDVQALSDAGQKSTLKKGLSKQAAAPAAEPEEFVTDGGFFGVVVPEDAIVYSVATKTADGRVKTGCVDGKKQAEAVVTSKSAPATTEVLDVK